jgi:hypothetical protein
MFMFSSAMAFGNDEQLVSTVKLGEANFRPYDFFHE